MLGRNIKLTVSIGSCSLFMGSVEVPSQGAQIIKVPAAHYEFGANLIDQRVIVLPSLYFIFSLGYFCLYANILFTLNRPMKCMKKPGDDFYTTMTMWKS